MRAFHTCHGQLADNLWIFHITSRSHREHFATVLLTCRNYPGFARKCHHLANLSGTHYGHVADTSCTSHGRATDMLHVFHGVFADMSWTCRGFVVDISRVPCAHIQALFYTCAHISHTHGRIHPHTHDDDEAREPAHP